MFSNAISMSSNCDCFPEERSSQPHPLPNHSPSGSSSAIAAAAESAAASADVAAASADPGRHSSVDDRGSKMRSVDDHILEPSSLLHFQHKHTHSTAIIPRYSSSEHHHIPNLIPDPGYVRILYTTLRDGEQSPGASTIREQKLAIALSLSRLGVDVVEAGFPAYSEENLDAVRSIAMEAWCHFDSAVAPVICAMARCSKRDIDVASEAKTPVISMGFHPF